MCFIVVVLYHAPGHVRQPQKHRTSFAFQNALRRVWSHAQECTLGEEQKVLEVETPSLDGLFAELSIVITSLNATPQRFRENFGHLSAWLRATRQSFDILEPRPCLKAVLQPFSLVEGTKRQMAECDGTEQCRAGQSSAEQSREREGECERGTLSQRKLRCV